MQELVERAAKVAGVLEINRNDIYNKVRRVEKERKAAAHANVCVTVSPEMSEYGVAHAVLVFGDEPADSDLGEESESDESIDEENCTSVEGV